MKNNLIKIEVQGITIAIEKVEQEQYLSLTDIARKTSEEPRFQINSWLKNLNTLEFLETWEHLHNPHFKREQLVTFKNHYLKNRNVLTVQKWIAETGSIGIISKSGRYGGGTWAHRDIALNFCYWLSPSFQVYLLKEFQRLKTLEAQTQNLQWHVSQLTDIIDEARNLLDTIPGQVPERNRLITGGD